MESPSNLGADRSKSSDLDNDLTSKFLSGEMSFAEYSNEWYNIDDEEEEESSKKLEDDSFTISGKVLRRRSKLTRLPPGLIGLMGEANLRFVRGDRDTAEKMCHEIIKQVPRAPEPYQTLAQLYEHDSEKSLQFALLAAHLSPPDHEEWLRLAEISKERGDVRQEMICYTQAIMDDPHNLSNHLKRIELLQRLESINMKDVVKVTYLKCYHKIVTSLLPTEGETIMKYAKMAVTQYHNNNEMERALAVMGSAYKKCPSLFTVEDLNILLELLIDQKQYQTCIEVFVASLGVEIEAEIQTVRNYNGEIEEHTKYLSCTMPDSLPIDLKSKLLVCFIQLDAIELFPSLLEEFLSNDVEKAGDLYMDIEEALSSKNYHLMAFKLLEPLVKTTSFDLGAVWLKHADCLLQLGLENDAINSYYKVLKHAPQHPDARKKLFNILENNGRIDEALEMLQQDFKYVVSAKLLNEQLIALKKYSKCEKYLEVGEALLSKNFVKFRHQDELKLACKSRCGIDEIHNFRTIRGESCYHENDIHFDDDETFKLTAQQEWDLFLELLGIACRLKKYYTMQRLTFGAIMSRSLSSHRSEIDYYCLQACILAKDYQNAFRFVREFSYKNPGPKCWNLLNVVINYIERNTHAKFLTRLFSKDGNNLVKCLFFGNNFLLTSRYLVALKYYLEYQEKCRDPLSAFLIAITILVMAAQKTVSKHHNLILQGMTYLQTYSKLRNCDQETNYNIGRAYQMLNINNLAIEYYERALSSECVVKCEKHGVLDLTKEIAFNLYVLYKDHSPLMARRYITKYIVIE